MTTLSREPAATETRFFVLTRNLSIYDAGLPQLRRLSGMISTVKATMHKVVGAMADDLLPPRDLANAAFAVMVWASSKMSAEERDKLLNGFQHSHPRSSELFAGRHHTAERFEP